MKNGKANYRIPKQQSLEQESTDNMLYPNIDLNNPQSTLNSCKLTVR